MKPIARWCVTAAAAAAILVASGAVYTSFAQETPAKKAPLAEKLTHRRHDLTR